VSVSPFEHSVVAGRACYVTAAPACMTNGFGYFDCLLRHLRDARRSSMPCAVCMPCASAMQWRAHGPPEIGGWLQS